MRLSDGLQNTPEFTVPLCRNPRQIFRPFGFRMVVRIVFAALSLVFISPSFAQLDGPVWSKRYQQSPDAWPGSGAPQSQWPLTNVTVPVVTVPVPSATVPGVQPRWNTTYGAQPPSIPGIEMPVITAPVSAGTIRPRWNIGPGSPTVSQYPPLTGNVSVPAIPNAPVTPQTGPAWNANQGTLVSALTALKAKQQAEPGNLDLVLQEARYQAWLSRHYTAASKFRKVLEKQPDNFEALMGYGNEMFWQGNWRDALAAYSKAMPQAASGGLGAHIGYLKVLDAQGRSTPAYQQALELDQRTGGQNSELGLVMAGMLSAIDMDAEAAAYANRPASDPDLAVRQAVFQAKRAVALGNVAGGQQLAAQLPGRFPGNYNALASAGEIFVSAGRFDDARKILTQAANFSPEREEALLELARIERLSGDSSGALRGFQKVIEANPESIKGWLGVADATRIRNDPKRAWHALETAHIIAPQSAFVYREKLRLAAQQKDREVFQHTLRQYQQAQPGDPHVNLWAGIWAAQNGEQVNVGALQQLLDPMAPELNAEAMNLIQGQSGQSWVATANQLPAAPSPEIQQAARDKLDKQIKITNPAIINITTGYEFSSLKDTSGAGVALTDWNEAFISGYWRRPHGMTWAAEYRAFERFADQAHQLSGGWNMHVGARWVVGLNLGGALRGAFIPRWRLGGMVSHIPNDRWSMDLRVNHLRFAGNPVYQVVPGVTWNWHKQFTSSARVYMTHSSPAGGSGNVGFTGYLDLLYKIAQNSGIKIFVSKGDQDADSLVAGLIAEKDFQSAGIELRLGINDNWAILPAYRFEQHQNFDLHAIGLSLNGSF